MRFPTISPRAIRVSTIGAVLSVGMASWLTFVAPPAQAIERPGMVITQDQVVEAEFGPVAGNNPAGEAHKPEDCRIQAYCDAVPLEVIVPDSITEDDEYFIQILMEWDTGRAPGDPVLEPEGYTLNDMDMYIYTDPATPEEAEARGATPDSNSDPYVARGASGSTPEQAFLFKPKGKYWINVVNYLGANTGFKIKATWVSEAFPSPFEALAPEFSPSTTVPRSTTTTTRPAPVVVDEGPPPTFAAPTPSLAPAEIGTDDDFDPDEFDTSDFDDELSAPALLDLTPAAARPGPPSGAALFFWLLALPLSLTAAGGFLLSRRRATL